MTLQQLAIGDWVLYNNSAAEVMFVNHRTNLVTIWDTSKQRYLETPAEQLEFETNLPHSPLHVFDSCEIDSKVA